MTSDRYDSVLISIDWISFRYFLRRDFRAYIVVVTADTNGTIGIYESPEAYAILHRPLRDMPAVIDFGFDGLVIYSSAGAVPDLVRFDVFVVREHSKKGRRVGAMREMLRSSAELHAKVEAAKAAMASASSRGARAADVASAVSPVLELVGGMVENLEDKVIEAYSGSKIFDVALVGKGDGEERKRINQAVVSPTGNIETKVDITLFQRQDDSNTSNEPTRVITAEPVIGETVTTRAPEPPPTTEPEEVELDAATIDIALRRPRFMFRMGWIAAALVPVSVAITAATSDSETAVPQVAIIFAALAIILSPALIYGAGQWARVRKHEKGLTRLGWVAVVFHLLSLGCIAIGVLLFISVLGKATLETSSFGEAIGQAIASFVGAILALTVMVMISLVPWLVSVITGAVFGRRSTRKTG